jgi:hypothetical protein
MKRDPPRRIELFCDYGADPLWARDSRGESGMVEIDSLPLSEALSRDLRAWAKSFMDITWPPDTRVADQAMFRLHSQEGAELAARLRRELGDGVEVVYDGGGT